MRQRVARSRELAVAYPVAAVARTMGVSRQAIYRRPTTTGPRPGGRAPDEVDRTIIEIAHAHPHDGYRMVTAIAVRRLGRPVNRKRVLRVMRVNDLIQRRRPLGRRKRPGTFTVTHPNQLWHLDMTSIWVESRGWCHLTAAIDCFTRQIVGWQLEDRCQSRDVIGLVDEAMRNRAFYGQLTIGTDNGPQFTSKAFRAHLGDIGVVHRRGGYRDPESQAFIESWFGKLKMKEVWPNSYESLARARRGVARFIADYHNHPHSSLGYSTPDEALATWEDQNRAA